MAGLPEDIVKLLLAILVGGLIGVERELHHKAAGFRTIILICMGSALFTLISLRTGSEDRIAANVVTGIGFIGGGVILRDAGRITGMTTASTIWLAAALGMGIGGGYYLLSFVATGSAMTILWVFPWIERWVGKTRDRRIYEIVSPIDPKKIGQQEALFRECGLRVHRRKQVKRGDEMVCTWETQGSTEAHDCLVERLLADADVKAFHF
ncbi:MAG: MgtC/SapB family protein [Candidatus Latescibacteria bacterium]|nr:MgtC/SapB family protein [Candidatus Latescibacterota bacterium]